MNGPGITVGLNVLWLIPGSVGGSEEYTVRLLRAVARLDPDDIDIRIYAHPDLPEVYPDLARRFEMLSPPTIRRSKVARIAAENTWLANVASDDDLLHHAGSVAPLTSPRPFVFTVHDLQPIEMPENFSPVKRRWMGTMLPSSCRRADLVLCPSRFAAGTVVDRFDIPEERVRVVPHGHDEVDADHVDAAVRRELVDRFGRFFLYPAIAYPHKRHADLVEAFARLATEAPDTSLVLTGGSGRETPEIDRRAAELGLADRVHRLGRVPETELDALYRSAAATVIPSVYEGFGNPVLEAMARGCPVIATRSASLPEVVGDAGLLTAPREPDDLADAMRRILTDDALVARLVEAGVERAGEYGWQPAGEALLAAYRDAFESSGPS